jgi:hypothetical protein
MNAKILQTLYDQFRTFKTTIKLPAKLGVSMFNMKPLFNPTALDTKDDCRNLRNSYRKLKKES